jgi:hypothetical protein
MCPAWLDNSGSWFGAPRLREIAAEFSEFSEKRGFFAALSRG